jgi:hypothetical protein
MKFKLLTLAALASIGVSCVKSANDRFLAAKEKSEIDRYHNRAFEICKDPSNYGWQQRELCYIYAVDLMDRLNRETDVRAFTMSYIFAKVGFYTFASHCVVVFFTTDNRVFVADDFSEGAVEVDMNKIDYDKGSWNGLVDLVDRTLWSLYGDPGGQYNRWTSITAPFLTNSKNDILKDFGPNAEVYFGMYGHAPKFPDSYTEY